MFRPLLFSSPFPYTTLFRSPYLALAAVCFFWGTTYLGIRMSLESFPPLVLVSARYILSGSLLLLYARAGGKELPRSEEHTSELQSHVNLVCRLLLEKKKNYY